MTKQSKLRLVRWTAIVAVIIVLRFIAGGRVWDYLVDHVILTGLLLVLSLFLALVYRSMQIQRSRHGEDARKIGGS
jgi:hypothetical protein